MPFLNEDFEDAGAYPGEPDLWFVLATPGGASVPALIGEPDGWPDIERFESAWDNDDWTDVLVADPAPNQESFEDGWDNGDWSATLVAVAAADFGAPGAEGFESSWDNDDWSTGFEVVDTNPGTLVVHDFDTGTPEPAEDFEEEWNGNEGWSTGFEAGDANPGTLVAFDFDSGTPEPVEDFEEEWPTLILESV